MRIGRIMKKFLYIPLIALQLNCNLKSSSSDNRSSEDLKIEVQERISEHPEASIQEGDHLVSVEQQEISLVGIYGPCFYDFGETTFYNTCRLSYLATDDGSQIWSHDYAQEIIGYDPIEWGKTATIKVSVAKYDRGEVYDASRFYFVYFFEEEVSTGTVDDTVSITYRYFPVGELGSDFSFEPEGKTYFGKNFECTDQAHCDLLKNTIDTSPTCMMSIEVTIDPDPEKPLEFTSISLPYDCKL